MPSAATSASWSALRASAASPSPGSSEASATPESAATIPIHCSVPGPLAVERRPASTGTIALVATIGATMLIVPTASAR